MNCVEPTPGKTLKSDLIAEWIKTEWMPLHPEQNLITAWVTSHTTDARVLSKLDPAFELPEGFRFLTYDEIDCPLVSRIDRLDYDGNINGQNGAFVFHFVVEETMKTVDVLVVNTHYSEDGDYQTALASVPDSFLVVWAAFTAECDRVAYAREPNDQVIIIGGRADSFVPKVEWDEVILPAKLKTDILEDVQSFFTKGIEVYKRLNLKPFRKLLLAGVPGTGKTMLCSALAKWALGQGYMVIYISSAQKAQNDQYGSTFGKIQYALSVAAYSKYPTLILLEELDAYLHEDEKALILNVLDGSESTIGEKGTLLISTTNYPEAIDERVLKRPGRLDRIFIIPETRAQVDVEQMLHNYLGAMWRDEHKALVPQLIGYPGAFIREVAIYALTQLAYDDLTELPLAMLQDSFRGLKDQIEARDKFLTQREVGFVPANGSLN